jgi:apolipoprotein N-acyltransferase
MSNSAVAEPAIGESAELPISARKPPGTGGPPSLALGRLPSLLIAAISGTALNLAFPGIGWWPVAPLAVAGLALATRGQRAGFGAVLGYLFGLAFFIPLLRWSGIYVGALPWLALAGAEAAFMAALGALLPRIWRVPGGVAGLVLAGSGIWVAQEAARDRLPFGGFPWGRLAFSQAQAPTAGLAALGGAPLVTAAVAAAGSLLAWSIVATFDRRPRAVGLALLPTVAILGCGLAVPLPVDGAPIRVAAVQGNVPRPGLEFNARRRAVLDNHVHATLALAARVRAGKVPAPDLVLWPENSSDIDPLRNPDAAAVIDDAVAAIGVPTLVGAVLNQPAGRLSNAGIVWSPGSGPGASYVKRHPAPFGEYIPYRSFFRHFSAKVDLVRADFISGNTLKTNRVVLPMGRARVGDVICFEVAYDGLVRDAVRQGANLLAVQTNNATFGHSQESVQQLAMSQLRAIESGRTVVHISTVGVSAVILPDGRVEQRSGLFRQEVMESDVPLRTSLTLATRVGGWPEGILATLGAGLLIAGALIRRRRRMSRTEPGPSNIHTISKGIKEA